MKKLVLFCIALCCGVCHADVKLTDLTQPKVEPQVVQPQVIVANPNQVVVVVGPDGIGRVVFRPDKMDYRGFKGNKRSLKDLVGYDGKGAAATVAVIGAAAAL